LILNTSYSPSNPRFSGSVSHSVLQQNFCIYFSSLMHATCAACLILLYLKYRNPEPYYAVLLSSEVRHILIYTLIQTRNSFILTSI